MGTNADRWAVAVAQTLKAERAVKGVSQDDLAAAAGVTGNTIGNYEAARRSPDVVTLAHIAAALGLTLGQFIQRAEQRLNGA